MKASKDSFRLLSLKKTSGGSIKGKCELINQEEGSEFRTGIGGIESDYIPHPDLVGLFDELHEPFVKAKGMDFMFEINKIGLTDAQKKKFKAVQKTVQQVNIQSYERMTPTGISVQYKDGVPHSAVITGTQVHANGKKVGTPTALIDLTRREFGIEEELMEIIDKMISEAYEYYFNGKRAQTSMDFEQEEGMKVAS